MNIFFLDHSAHNAAMMLVDSHVIKMMLESTQMLANVYHMPENASLPKPLTKSGQPYRTCHWNHPCSAWARASENNWFWLLHYAFFVDKEYTFRFGKVHGCSSAIDHMFKNLPVLPRIWGTLPPMCVPEQYKQENLVKAYRAYYVGEKSHLFAWTRRSPPKFISESTT